MPLSGSETHLSSKRACPRIVVQNCSATTLLSLATMPILIVVVVVAGGRMVARRWNL